jgi:N-acetylglucosamine kinase-like BadF-type ATPase
VDYCLSLDGGGTKLSGILFDEQYKLAASGKGHSINYVKQEEIVETIRKCLDECLNSQEVKALKRVYISMPASADLVIQLLQERVAIQEVVHLNEGLMSLLAGLQRKQGIVALAGTGSGLFRIEGDDWCHIGGWGNLLGDEGSACYIGREGISAVLKEYEHRGEKTAIRGLIEEQWGCTNKESLIESVYRSDKPRLKIASASILVAQAADLGDEQAIHILEHAGVELALQSRRFLQDLTKENKVDVMVAGSVWKGSVNMYNSFKHHVCSYHSGVSVHLPMFEPVVGGVADHFLRLHSQATPEFISLLRQQYDKYLYKPSWKKS